MIYRFPKSARILRRSEYQKLHRSSATIAGKYLVLDYMKEATARPRVGITVTKKFGKAHDRNRFKRLIREAFRKSQPQIQGQPLLLHIRPRALAKEACASLILEEFVSLLGQVSL